MHALLLGTGGDRGWPQDGCRCASCMRARSEGLLRRPGRVLVDGTLEIVPGQKVLPETWPPATPAHVVRQLSGGLDITGPDGGRMLLAAGPGDQPEPPDDAAPYDLALLDLLEHPEQLGRLRAAGLIRPQTAVVALYCDHRVTSEMELIRRCDLWQATAGQDGQLITSPAPGIPAVIPVQAGIRPHRTLITGGARSGKSTEAELRLAGEPRVTYVAAGPWAGSGPAGTDDDPDREWAERVARHQARRPGFWQTVETLDIAGVLGREQGAVLIDGIGTWLAAVLDEAGMWADPPAPRSGPEAAVQGRIDELADAWRHTRALVVAVTDQVGSGLVPPFPAGRIFRDQLGWLNQRLAAESELNLLIVAGRVTTLPG